MKLNEIPLSLKRNQQPIYGDFGYRFAALLLDGVIMLPLTLSTLFFDCKGLYNFYYTMPITLVVSLFFYTYLPKRFGATPGKLIVGLQLLKMNGDNISYKDAFMRYLPYFINSIISLAVMAYCVGLADTDEYAALPWKEQNGYLVALAPITTALQVIFTFGLFTSDLVIYLTNNRNRSLKDLVAGTAVVFIHMVPDIKAEMNTTVSEPTDRDTTANS